MIDLERERELIYLGLSAVGLGKESPFTTYT